MNLQKTKDNDIKMMQASFSCITKDLLQTLKFLKGALPKNRSNKQYSCEMTIKTNEVDFVVIGARRTLYCKTQGVVKATMPLLYLYDIVRKINEFNTHIAINDGSVTINNINVFAWTFFFENDSILRSINLPINFSPSDIMQLPEIYTHEEIEFNKLTELHQRAYKTLSKDIKQVYKNLKKYGFTLFDIEKIIRDKVYNNKPKTQ
jgi:hypothetical protein